MNVRHTIELGAFQRLEEAFGFRKRSLRPIGVGGGLMREESGPPINALITWRQARAKGKKTRKEKRL
jgi:hypothetical protein